MKRKESCTKSSTMGYMLHWKCAQYSKEATCLGKGKKTLQYLILIWVSHMPTKCNIWPYLDSGVSKPSVKIFIRQVGKFEL